MGRKDDRAVLRGRVASLRDRVATALSHPRRGDDRSVDDRSTGDESSDRADSEEDGKRSRHAELLVNDEMRAIARRLFEASNADDLRFSVTTDSEGHGYARVELVYDAEADR
ncbi:hypothetical protein [Halegenticoccus tardaugens]|uniref:hypothetical protein n=1 Tax=Halegenticoccus tardaugens TaxID=2071624 RepID=UPI00100C23F4|nr:hypothetical protein [Halegenticoccus tardaugens]